MTIHGNIGAYQIQAKVFTPPIFMAHDPQIPSRHERLKVNVGSSSFLILIKASSTIGPQLDRKRKKLEIIHKKRCISNIGSILAYWHNGYQKREKKKNLAKPTQNEATSKSQYDDNALWKKGMHRSLLPNPSYELNSKADEVKLI